MTALTAPDRPRYPRPSTPPPTTRERAMGWPSCGAESPPMDTFCGACDVSFSAQSRSSQRGPRLWCLHVRHTRDRIDLLLSRPRSDLKEGDVPNHLGSLQ